MYGVPIATELGFVLTVRGSVRIDEGVACLMVALVIGEDKLFIFESEFMCMKSASTLVTSR